MEATTALEDSACRERVEGEDVATVVLDVETSPRTMPLQVQIAAEQQRVDVEEDSLHVAEEAVAEATA